MRNEYTIFHDIKDTLKSLEEKRINRQFKLASLIIKKEAFDTRMFKPDIDVNPRVSMQNFHSSQPKLNPALAKKLFQLKRVYDISEILKQEFQREPEYQDSYIRSLNHQLFRTLRIKEADAGYADSQQSLSSINYAEELLYSRYRLTLDNIEKMSDKNLRDYLLKIDDKLIKLDPIVNPKEYSIAHNDKVAYSDAISKVLQSPSDSEKVITIRVSDTKDEEKNKLQNIVASIKLEMDSLFSKKIQDDSFVNFIENNLMSKYKKALDDKLEIGLDRIAELIKTKNSEIELDNKIAVRRNVQENFTYDSDLEDKLAELDILMSRE